jgi:hypothetical protein
LIRRLHSAWSGPWICCGDFNEILSGDEHFGSSEKSDSQMSLSMECLQSSGLLDLGYIGPKYTWNNKQHGDNLVCVPLDRIVENFALIGMFEGYQVENVVTTSFDHMAISITLMGLDELPCPGPVHQLF